jgi:curved DNA-binding protein CbpA
VTKYHPDNKKTGNADKFRLIHEAREILADPTRKKEYDAVYRNRFKDRDEYQIVSGGIKGGKDHGSNAAPAFQKIRFARCAISKNILQRQLLYGDDKRKQFLHGMQKSIRTGISKTNRRTA